jgi:transglutaminase-like putative cysteine protease
MPARTVFGLAYEDGATPAFRFHAWNEVEVDGRWQAVDPTWNQLRPDATHIPLPAEAGRALELLTGGTSLSFRIREVDYF